MDEHAILDKIQNTLWKADAYAIVRQVRNSTGFTRARARYADAIAVSLWPSRGVYFAGVEVKSDRSDWRRELDNPDKAEDFFRFCREWYVAAPAGVVLKEEVPLTWGFIEVSDKRAKIVKRSPINKDVQPPSMGFIAALLRKQCEVQQQRIEHALYVAKAEAEKVQSELSPQRVQELLRAEQHWKKAIQDLQLNLQEARDELSTYKNLLPSQARWDMRLAEEVVALCVDRKRAQGQIQDLRALLSRMMQSVNSAHSLLLKDAEPCEPS